MNALSKINAFLSPKPDKIRPEIKQLIQDALPHISFGDSFYTAMHDMLQGKVLKEDIDRISSAILTELPKHVETALNTLEN